MLGPVQVTSPLSRSLKLGQSTFSGRMFRETHVDGCCSHMVPFDQPEAALVSYFPVDYPPENVLLTRVSSQDMLTRWITDVPFA